MQTDVNLVIVIVTALFNLGWLGAVALWEYRGTL